MRVKKIKLALVSVILLVCMGVNILGCDKNISAKNLMDGITPNKVTAMESLSEGSKGITDFAVRLFKQTNPSSKNTLISPLSVLCALAITTNGANGETLEQMQKVLGIDIKTLNSYLYTYLNCLPQGEKYKLRVANSIWLADNEKLTVNQKFLQTNADYYNAEIYKTPFNGRTAKDINAWVNNKTEGLIKKVIDNVPAFAIVYIVNALVFEAEWQRIYKNNQIANGLFTLENGSKQTVSFMHSIENCYIEDENATGFIKYYSGEKYAFVALLPNGGVSVSDYINTLNGESLNNILANVKNQAVYTAIPKFNSECNIEMSNILSDMGMPIAFDVRLADFSNLGTYDLENDGNIFLNKIIHKTYIRVEEKGTKAGAVVVVESCGNGSSLRPKEVLLNRPFVYMLIDCENKIPFFIGTTMNVK